MQHAPVGHGNDFSPTDPAFHDLTGHLHHPIVAAVDVESHNRVAQIITGTRRNPQGANLRSDMPTNLLLLCYSVIIMRLFMNKTYQVFGPFFEIIKNDTICIISIVGS